MRCDHRGVTRAIETLTRGEVTEALKVSLGLDALHVEVELLKGLARPLDDGLRAVPSG
jgi:hypothetical protein